MLVRDRGRGGLRVAILIEMLIPQYSLHPSWYVQTVPDPSERDMKLVGSKVKQLARTVVLKQTQPELLVLSLPLRGREESPVPGGFRSRFKVCVTSTHCFFHVYSLGPCSVKTSKAVDTATKLFSNVNYMYISECQ